MFTTGSRYVSAGTVTAMKLDGTLVAVTRIPLPGTPPLIGFHRSQDGKRLDLIAARYLGDATAFWRLCDVNKSVVPDALAARNLIGISILLAARSDAGRRISGLGAGSGRPGNRWNSH